MTLPPGFAHRPKGRYVIGQRVTRFVGGQIQRDHAAAQKVNHEPGGLQAGGRIEMPQRAQDQPGGDAVSLRGVTHRGEHRLDHRFTA